MARNIVISDVAMKDVALTETEFRELLKYRGPAGYTQFRKLVSGNYDYRYAFLRTILGSQINDKARLTALTLTVDVPDIRDNGTETLTSAGATVNFVRTFLVAPEVVAVQKGGAGLATPRVSSITTTSFFVRCYDETNTAVAGDVTWAAVGY